VADFKYTLKKATVLAASVFLAELTVFFAIYGDVPDAATAGLAAALLFTLFAKL